MSDPNLDDFLTASKLLEERRPLDLDAHELDDLQTALIAAREAVESVRAGGLTGFLRVRFAEEDDAARTYVTEELARWRKLENLVSSELAGHPGAIAMRAALRRRREDETEG